MDVLVDTSVWISFFKGRKDEAKVCEALDYLLSGDEVVLNDVILSELLPPIVFRKEHRVEACLKSVRKIGLETDWDDIRRMQVVCIANGINKVGIPDLMIAQQAIQKGLPVFSLDGHFRQMAKKLPLKLWPA